MLNRRPFRTYAPMHVVYKSKDFGTQLWLGDYYAATDYTLLKAKNICSVFTAAAMLGVAYPVQLQMNHKTIHAFDMPSYKMTPHFEEAYQFIHQGLKKGNVLVHCAAGISRSTTCVLVYLMKQQGHTFNQALEMVRAKRSIVNPNYGFQSELKKYELHLKKLRVKKQSGGDNTKNEVGDLEKKAVLDFLRDKNEEKMKEILTGKQQNRKMNTTLGYSVVKSQIYNGFARGKSVNPTQKSNPLGNTMGYTGSGLSGQNRLSSVNPLLRNLGSHQSTSINRPSTLNQLNNQFLTFKLQVPRIVTIKK